MTEVTRPVIKSVVTRSELIRAGEQVMRAIYERSKSPAVAGTAPATAPRRPSESR